MKYFIGTIDKSKLFNLDVEAKQVTNILPSEELDEAINDMKINMANGIENYFVDPIFFGSESMIEFNFYQCRPNVLTQIMAHVCGIPNPDKEKFYLYEFDGVSYNHVYV